MEWDAQQTAGASLEIFTRLGAEVVHPRPETVRTYAGVAAATVTVPQPTITLTVQDVYQLTDSTHVKLSVGGASGGVDWSNTLVVALLLVYFVNATVATNVWPWLKEPLETAEQRLSFVCAIYAFYLANQKR